MEVRPFSAARHETYEIFNIVHLLFLEGTILRAEVSCQGLMKKMISSKVTFAFPEDHSYNCAM